MPEWIVVVANFLQACVPVLSFAAYVPQWQQLIETKSSEDISLKAWLMWVVSTTFALFYAVVQFFDTGQGLVLVLSTIIALVFIMITVFLIYIYRKTPTEIE